MPDPGAIPESGGFAGATGAGGTPGAPGALGSPAAGGIGGRGAAGAATGGALGIGAAGAAGAEGSEATGAGGAIGFGGKPAAGAEGTTAVGNGFVGTKEGAPLGCCEITGAGVGAAGAESFGFGMASVGASAKVCWLFCTFGLLGAGGIGPGAGGRGARAGAEAAGAGARGAGTGAGLGAGAGWATGGSDPKGRVTESMVLAEGAWVNIFEVGGLMAEGAMMGAAAVAERWGSALAAVAPGFGGSEIRMVSFLILPWVIFRAGFGIGAVGAEGIIVLGGVADAGAAGGIAGSDTVVGDAAMGGRATGWAAAAPKPLLMAIVCFGNDMPAGISGFCVILLGGATGSLAPAGKLGLGGGGGGTAILCPSCLRPKGRQSF
ncbi:MAG: hypothetical protein SFU85_12030 [Candidatus Methylacidiphilales bacterium]|nr:hypothetical protein [Candidatus Methylacidiphilales bacterium]